MKILRYTAAVQRQLHSKTKPEPWLHCAVQADANNQGKSLFAIYVWDTRNVIESGVVAIESTKVAGQHAVDNHQPLHGSNANMFDFANANRPEALKQRCRAAFAAYLDARDALYHNLETKPENISRRQHETMMRCVRKLGQLGVKHNIPEWARFDYVNYLSDGETVPYPTWLRD